MALPPQDPLAAIPGPWARRGQTRGRAWDSRAAGSIDWFATLAQGRDSAEAPVRRPRRRDPEGLTVVVWDCSGSTLRCGGLAVAAGAVAGLMAFVRRRRWRFALLQLVGGGVHLAVPPGPAPDSATLAGLAAGGGGTPLGVALATAWALLAAEHRTRPHQAQTLVVFTDGRSRDAIPPPPQPRVPTTVVDVELGPVRLGRAVHLAQALTAAYTPVDALLVGE